MWLKEHNIKKKSKGGFEVPIEDIIRFKQISKKKRSFVNNLVFGTKIYS